MSEGNTRTDSEERAYQQGLAHGAANARLAATELVKSLRDRAEFIKRVSCVRGLPRWINTKAILLTTELPPW